MTKETPGLFSQIIDGFLALPLIKEFAQDFRIRIICEGLGFDDDKARLMTYVHRITEEGELGIAVFKDFQAKKTAQTITQNLNEYGVNILDMYIEPAFRQQIWDEYTKKVLPAFRAKYKK